MIPACGPPRSLSPLKHVSAAPARTERRTDGSLGEQLEVVGEHAGADVVDHRHAERAERLDLDLLDEADRAEVRRVHAQDRAGAVAERGA